MKIHDAICTSDYSRAYCFPELGLYDGHILIGLLEDGLILVYSYDPAFNTYTRLHSLNCLKGE
jgi:hypothetical protein